MACFPLLRRVRGSRRRRRGIPTALVLSAILVACASDSAPDGLAVEDGPALAAEVEGWSLDRLIDELPDESVLRFMSPKVDDLLPPLGKAARTELGLRIDRGVPLSDEQWQRALKTSGALRIRDRWPIDCPFAVSMVVPRWLGACEIRAEPRIEGWEPASAGSLKVIQCGNCLSWRIQDERYQTLGLLPADGEPVVFDVTIERAPLRYREERWERLLAIRQGTLDRDAPEPEPPGPDIVWRGELGFEVSLVDELDEVLPPVRSAAIDRKIADSVRVSTTSGDGRSGPGPWASLSLELDPAELPELGSIGFSFDVDVLCEGEVVGSAPLLLLDPYSAGVLWSYLQIDPTTYRIKTGSTTFSPAPARMDPELLAARGWELRLRSSEANALRDWGADRRWIGTVHVPLAEVVGR